MTPDEHFNWNRSASTRPRVAVTPGTEAEVLDVVRGPAELFPAPVRAAGHAHSLNRCIEADGGTLVSTAGLDPPPVVDRGRMRITVGAGTSLLRIAQTLLPDFQLPVMPEIGDATAGSLACCGTKDSSLGDGPGQVSSAVVGMRVATPGGIEEVTDEERLRLLRSSYGLLGIVTQVTFAIEPVQVIEFDYEVVPADPAPPLDAVRQGAGGFLAFLLPHERRMLVERRTVVPGAPRPGVLDRIQRHWRSLLWESAGSGLAALLSRSPEDPVMVGLRERLGPALLDILLELALDPVRFRARRADTMIDFEADRPDYFDFTFWAFPARQWPVVLPRYLAFCETFTARTSFRPSLPTEIYSIRHDRRSLLSFAYDEDVFTLDMVHHRRKDEPFDPRWIEMNQAFNRFAAEHGGRPLLNQTKHLDRAVMDLVLARNEPLAEGWRTLGQQAAPRLTSGYFRDLGLASSS